MGSDKSNVCSSEHGIFCKGIAHFSGRMICDKANGVERLSCSACRDENHFARHILFVCAFSENICEKHAFIGHSAVARISVCKHTVIGLDYLVSERSKLFDIVLHDRVVEHIVVHCRRYYFLACTRHYGSGQHIVGDTACDFSDNICACGGDHDYIGFLGKSNVLNAVLKIPVESIDKAFVAR